MPHKHSRLIILFCTNILLILSIDFGIGHLYIPTRQREYYKQQLLKDERHINRVSDRMYHHGLVPNTQLMYHWNNDADYPVYINSLGLIDKTVRTVSQTSDKHRVLFIGDSFTEGVGFPYDQTFVGIIANTITPQNVEVLNVGLQGYSPKLYVEKTKFLLEEQGIRANQAIIMLDISDIHNEAYGYKNFIPAKQSDFSTTHNKKISRTFLKKIFGYVLDHSFITNSIYTLTWHKHQLQMKKQNTLPYDADYQAWTYDDHQYETYGKDGLALCDKYLATLVALLRAHDIDDITLVVYPWPQQILHNDLESRHVIYWEKFATNQHIQYINLFPEFFDHQKSENLYIADSHFNSLGHNLVARVLLNELFAK